MYPTINKFHYCQTKSSQVIKSKQSIMNIRFNFGRLQATARSQMCYVGNNGSANSRTNEDSFPTISLLVAQLPSWIILRYSIIFAFLLTSFTSQHLAAFWRPWQQRGHKDAMAAALHWSLQGHAVQHCQDGQNNLTWTASIQPSRAHGEHFPRPAPLSVSDWVS